MTNTELPEAAAENAEGTVSYKDTVFLPKTDFPMRAGLPQREPIWLERWEKMDLYNRLRAQSKGRKTFTLHEGPPYANGEAHVGHAFNRILKDIVVRSQQMMGKDAAFVPGWDCHGLPIEWKIEEKYRKSGKNKDEVPVADFIKECHDFANHWTEVQGALFQRLGAIGDWEHPYKTLQFEAEAQILREFHKFLMKGLVYQGSKPVMWSAVERTALAEAEVEYHDKISATIWVKFPVVKGPDALKDTSVVIYTTTPWTIPGNRAVAYSETVAYGLYEVKAVEEDSLAKVGERLALADALAGDVASAAKITDLERLGDCPELADVICAHPFAGSGYEFPVPLLPGDHVTDEEGTGFVHTAPGHGAEDYEVGRKFGLEVPQTVDENGVYYEHVPLFGGKTVIHADGKRAGKFGEANKLVSEELIERGAMLANGHLEHSYPHSWRSKAPLIFRNTPQWFIALDKEINDEYGPTTLRQRALSEIDRVEWFPKRGHDRIYAMVENRPDWVISRQRTWGVPLGVFKHKETGELLKDEKVNERIAEAFEKEGITAWHTSEASRFLGNDYAAEDYEKVDDILDVWFDSASTHAFVLDKRPDLTWPADLYLEGSDQHRGWFHSSLLESCGTRGRAPYDQVLTHGFILDEKGYKMAKSGTNAMPPDKVTSQYGAEILRLWTASSDFTDDTKLGNEVIKGAVDAYRKLRNTARFLLGSLAVFDESERVAVSDMPELERYMLHRLAELDELVRHNYAVYDFNRVFHTLHNFATTELSAFYFDIRKDSLYCDRPDSLRRRACRTVLDHIFHCWTKWLAPILVFTMEEVWLSRFGDDKDQTIHMEVFPDIPADWRDEALAAKWKTLRELRRVVTGALEVERREKRIGSSLEANPQVYVSDAKYVAALEGIDLAEVSITSQASLIEGAAPEGAFTLPEVAGVSVVPQKAEGGKCERSWRILPEVGSDPDYPTLSLRDADAVRFLRDQGLLK
ncbi:MAG: isoleucine--tRNA ligase [Alphaproteobacteria bacterium]|nr:MAG: isoleucine--tRNA ligase [Alphaproteobacteria bacterium]